MKHYSLFFGDYFKEKIKKEVSSTKTLTVRLKSNLN